ncbi:Retrovirus-related Pol polyprotein from transposon RE1 [Vitis vinifera]|uniref:Retrovirus-related Pol polyprotein from transposon RE1 n=1 Tax=Vitis vinifera TaxID=29760 RepID=A0A438KJB3_VITVI|nr:Retrovirus-related Pol polyprotein from transposon RE1 [Vitis vinifera]
MTSDIEGVDQPTVYSGNERVMVGNGQSLAISHTGSISSLVPIGSQEWYWESEDVKMVSTCGSSSSCLSVHYFFTASICSFMAYSPCFPPKSNHFSVMVELSLLIISFALICIRVALIFVWQCPYTPSQNGIAERKHRHVTETGLTLMFHARVPLSLWVEAFSTAVFLINRLPSPSLAGKTPYELLNVFLVLLTLVLSDSLPSPSFSNSLCLPCNDIPHLSSTSSPSPQVPLDEDSLLDSVATDSTTPSPVSSSSRVTTSSHPMITRGKVGIFKPRLYHAMHISSSSQLFQALLALKEPRGFKSAAKHPEWLSAMDDEIHALKKNDTWVLVPRPQHHNVVGCRWIFKTKLHSDGSIERHKARLVAQGFSQVHGLDFGDTFSPVVRPATIRIILSLAVTSGWRLHQLDVKNVFLHGFLNEEVYMEQPPGYTDSQFPQHVCRLKRALYGLKQAPRAWFHRFSSFLLKLGFYSSQADSSLFVYHSSLGTVYLLLYVDDMIITGSTPSLVHTFTTRLSNEFSMKDLGDLHYFLGVEVQANEKGLFLSQTKYALDLLQRASMIDAKPISTPFVVGQHLSAEGTLFSNPTLFRSLAGALQYLTISRPDLSFNVNSICQFMHAPTEDHFRALKRILRYVKGTAHHGLQLHKQSTRDLLGYSDADWAGCPDTRRSTTGYAIFFGANLISWSSKKQSTVSRSSAEAEYRSLAVATADIAWIIQLLRDLHVTLSVPPKILCDNQSAILWQSIRLLVLDPNILQSTTILFVNLLIKAL